MKDSEPLSDKERRFKRMAKNIAMQLDAFWYADNDFERASGDCICESCGLRYYDHPQKANGLVLTCDGRFWHL